MLNWVFWERKRSGLECFYFMFVFILYFKTLKFYSDNRVKHLFIENFISEMWPKCLGEG